MSAYLNTSDLNDELEALEAVEGDELEELDETDAERLTALRELRDEISEWDYNETLVPEDEFEDYARQLAEDIGAIDSDAGWPLSYIDWPAAAEALKMDYTVCEFDGDTYYYRS